MTLTEGKERLATALLLPINPAAVIILGVYTVVWGIWVANPFWTVFTQAALYSKLDQVAPEYFWGTVAIVCGCVTIYGAVTRRYHSLVLGATTAGWHWFMISILYFMGDAYNTGGITALIFCVYGAYIYLNLRVNFKNDRKSPFILDPPKARNRK